MSQERWYIKTLTREVNLAIQLKGKPPCLTSKVKFIKLGISMDEYKQFIKTQTGKQQFLNCQSGF